MRLACIDIGSNTTRLLVADVRSGALSAVHEERVFTALGQCLDGDGAIPPAKLDELSEVVARQAQRARELGAEPCAIATAVIRRAPNGEELHERIRAVNVPLRILDGAEEARLAFRGAAAMQPGTLSGRLAVVDLGGGSSEIAVGLPGHDPEWSVSLELGSGILTAHCLTTDPPTAPQLAAARERAAAVLAPVDIPPVEQAIAVGGSATTLRRLIGPTLAPAELRRALDALDAVPSATIAERHGIERPRARVLPAGLIILEALSGALGVPLEAGFGGVREGALLLDAAERSA